MKTRIMVLMAVIVLLMALLSLEIWETRHLEDAAFLAHFHSGLNKMIPEKAKDDKSTASGRFWNASFCSLTPQSSCH